MSYDERGELMGHITIGLELVNSLWRKLIADNGEKWKNLSPASEDVRLHLLHLIGAHHGDPEFGSPVSPKTPEAMALHYIDNLDARLEMFAAGYTNAKNLAPTHLRSRAAFAREPGQTVGAILANGSPEERTAALIDSTEAVPVTTFPSVWTYTTGIAHGWVA